MRLKYNLNPFKFIKSLFRRYKNNDYTLLKKDTDEKSKQNGMYDVNVGHLSIKNSVVIRIQQLLFIIFLISSTFAIIKLILLYIKIIWLEFTIQLIFY